MKTLVTKASDKSINAVGTYVCVAPDNASALALRATFASDQVKLYSANELHCTVVYSKAKPLTEHHTYLPLLNPQATYTARALRLMAIENSKHPGEFFVALEMESPSLFALNAKWQNWGFTGTFPDYLCHVSLASKVPEDVALDFVQTYNNRVRSLPLLVFGSEKLDYIFPTD